MRLRTLFGLIFCNLVWSAHPLMGKYLMSGFTPDQAAWLRYASALLFYCLAFAAVRVTGRARDSLRGGPFFFPTAPLDAWLVFVLGFSAFCLSPLLQMTGLSASRATDNSLIVALEPLMTVLIAWVLLGERPTPLHFIAFGIALVGFALLTGLGPSTFVQGVDLHLMGNLLLLASLFGEALYSSMGRKLIVRHSPTAVFGSAIFLGVVCLTLATAYGSKGGLPSFSQVLGMPSRSVLGLLWVGPLGTALCYLFWMSSLREAPVASLALTLFVQPVLGPVLGALFLDERLSATQCFGSGLILLAVFGQAWVEIRRKNV